MRFAFRRANDSADSPPYLSLLKLHTAPFGNEGGVAFFYADAERAQYLDMLQHLTQYSEELLLVVADEGGGKSALLEKYLDRREEHWRVCRFNGSDGLSLDKLFIKIGECFGVNVATLDAAALLDALRQQLDAAQEQQLAVLVIDDAHLLSEDALEAVIHLASLEGEHGRLIRVLLFADSSVEADLSTPRFSQIGAWHLMKLKPLPEADCTGYLLHRLAQAGYVGPSPFSTAELKQIYRQSTGVPARLNQAAHNVLLGRCRETHSAASVDRGFIKAGLAATALIGAVLGMHERINEFLGGTAHGSMAVSAERPVLRLADKDNPWAVVIRDGESIQISCGAPQAQTIAVRPRPAAPAMVAALEKPLLQPVAMPEEAPTVVDVPPTEDAGEEAASVEGAKAVDTAPAATEQIAGEVPLVIKPPTPDIAPELPVAVETAPLSEEMTAAKGTAIEDERAQSKEQKLELKSIAPDPVIGDDKPQTIQILGNGLQPGSRVAASWSGKVKVLEPSQVVVHDAQHMAITITTGTEAAVWAVQVSTPDKQRSNVLRFQVAAPKPVPAEPTPAVAAVEKAATLAEGDGPETANVVESQAMTPSAAQPAPAVVTAAKRQPVAEERATPGKAMGIQGIGWVKRQPASNYTLQLLAASEAQALQGFADEHTKLMGPLGRFEQQRGNKRLHVLVQGSYASRDEAESVASRLPGDLQPWIRSFADVHKAMATPMPKAAPAAEAVTGGIKDTAWVWSQDPNQYTIQLAGAGDETSIEAVMKNISLPGELAVVQTLRNDKPWYALVYGRFASHEAAEGTVARLPEAQKRAGPWIRRFSALQDEVARASSQR